MESDGWEKWMESALIHGKKPLDIAIDFFLPPAKLCFLDCFMVLTISGDVRFPLPAWSMLFCQKNMTDYGLLKHHQT
jgi:hypothetical protein